mmetsp:Transcript_114264/g.354799  ORF Transcript_114264/g.354799 Transcript_114264/m.354799 type:complete len:305 (-) Transcript_114264:68-982(-)
MLAATVALVPISALLLHALGTATAVAPPPAAAPAPAAAAALALPLWHWLRVVGAVPDAPLDALTQLPPEPQLREGLHDTGPAAPDAVVEALGLCYGRAVQEADELRAAALWGAVVGRAHWKARVELQEVTLFEPINEQALHLAMVVHARPCKGSHGPANRRHDHLALTHDAANGAEHPASLCEEGLLRPLEHLRGGRAAHGPHQHLQGRPLLIEALAELIGCLRQPVEGHGCPWQVGVLVWVQSSGELTVRVGHVRLAVATEVRATKAQHTSSTQHTSILRTDSDYLVRRGADEDLLLLVRLCD